ncbi:MAG: hypothetical protein V8S24_04280 [Gordonibacter pamelaeae]
MVGESDRGSTNDLIAPKAVASKNCAGEVAAMAAGVEKVDVFELAARYPEAFGRPLRSGLRCPARDSWFDLD